MADASRKSQLTAELLLLAQQQLKTLEDATFLGWQPDQLDAYQKRGEQVSFLRHQLALADAQEKFEVLPGTLPIAPDVDADP